MGLSADSEQLYPDTHVSSGVIQTSYKSQPWYEAYIAALFEADREQIGESIHRAELLILHRERELFTGAFDLKERHALNHALHALRALAGCLKL